MADEAVQRQVPGEDVAEEASDDHLFVSGSHGSMAGLSHAGAICSRKGASGVVGWITLWYDTALRQRQGSFQIVLILGFTRGLQGAGGSGRRPTKE